MNCDEEGGKHLIQGSFIFNRYSDDGKRAIFRDKYLDKYICGFIQEKKDKYLREWSEIVIIESRSNSVC
jgi:hypothetical protein